MKSTRKSTGAESESTYELTMDYRGIAIKKHNGRFTVVANRDLLKLGMCTVKTLQRGHKGYLKLERLVDKIDNVLGTECTPVGQ